MNLIEKRVIQILIYFIYLRYSYQAILLDNIEIINKNNINKLCVNRDIKIVDCDNYKSDLLVCATYYVSEGWHVFNLESLIASDYDHITNKMKAFSAGLLEGYIYHHLIDYHYINIFSTIMNRTHLTNRTLDYVYNQFKYVENLVKDNIGDRFDYRYKENFLISKLLKYLPKLVKKYFTSKNEVDYLETLELTIEQYKGLYQGYKLASSKNGKDEILSEKDFYLLTMQGDLEDILIAYETERFGNGMWKKEKDCSGFVKYVKETNNLIVGHNTHNYYSLLNRIYKNYKLNIRLSTGKILNDFKYSSRPGDLNSKDDYYVLSNNIVVIETSLEIVDLNIYKNLRYNTIPKWIRVNIANKLAKNNKEWIDLFFRHNSGTHNNQWLIVDYNKFDDYVEKLKINSWNKEENKSQFIEFSKIDKDFLTSEGEFYKELIPRDIIHIVEQIPLLDKKYFKDVSEDLINQTYVASYNAPYFEEVIKEIGYFQPPYNEHDYFHARRFYLFNQLQADVKDINMAKDVLRFHSKEDICDTIGARCDMVKNIPFGAVDAKLTDSQFIKNNQLSTIIYGPPFIQGVSEPFDFKNYPDITHLGIPDRIDFNWTFA